MEEDIREPFLRSKMFDGERKGYVFNMGKQGLGYYLDVPLHSAPPAPNMFVESTSFTGAKPGFVFKMGRLGLGYYHDVPEDASVSAASAARRERAVRAGRVSVTRQPAPSAAGRGFRFGTDNRARTFRSYCERSVQLGLLSSAGVETLCEEVAALAEGEREEAMLRVVERGMRGQEVVVVGATGRTPRGWWGDESVGLLLPNGLFDAKRPELLPVRMPLRSAALGSTLGEQPIPEVMDVGVRVTNLRLRVPPTPPANPQATPPPATPEPPPVDLETDEPQIEEPPDVSAYDAEADLPSSILERYAPLVAARHASPSDAAIVLEELRQVRGDGNRLIIDIAGSVKWADEMAMHVRPVRLSIEHLWSGDAKTRLIGRCCQLDILQCMRPLPGMRSAQISPCHGLRWPSLMSVISPFHGLRWPSLMSVCTRARASMARPRPTG